MARFVLSNKKFIQKHFKHTLCADEIFLHTMIQTSPYKDMVINNSLRFIDWERGNPYTFTIEDYSKLMNTPDLFERKFDENKDSDIINAILREVLCENHRILKCGGTNSEYRNNCIYTNI